VLLVFVAVIIPTLVGHAIELTLIVPISPLTRVSLLWIPNMWSMGFGITVFSVQTVLFGPLNMISPYKAETDRIVRDGPRNLNLTRIMRNLVVPIVFTLVRYI